MVAPMTLWARQNQLTDIKTTLSSWDGCMAKAYCKWPVIIGIIIGASIVLSLLFCLARCLCCGAECCCACFSCCNACWPSPRRRHDRSSPKYSDHPSPQQPFQPSPYQGYQPNPPPPFYHSSPHAPQYAQFDAAKKAPVNEDALPAMPGWETAATRRVLDNNPKNEDVELGHMDPAHEQTAPMLANQAPPPRTGYRPPPPNHHHHHHSAHHSGDLGNGFEDGAAASYYRDDTHHPAYRTHPPYTTLPSTYAPSEAASRSTRYEPSSIDGGQERGTVYHSRSPPPVQQQQSYANPSAGRAVPPSRRPVQDSWRDA